MGKILKELKEAIKVVQAYGLAVKQAVEKTIDFLPIMTRQHISSEAKKKLDTSYQDYMDAVNVEVKGDVFVVDLDEDNWLANAVESGGDPMDMKNQLSTRQNVRVSKCVLNPRNKVMTIRGWVKIKDVVVGDMVLTHSGKFREVKEVLKTKTEPGTKYTTIKMDNHARFQKKTNPDVLTSPSLSLTSDHLVLTPKGWVEAGTLKKGDLVGTPCDNKHLCNYCKEPMLLNSAQAKYCVNNSCSRKASYRDGKIDFHSPEAQAKAIERRNKTMKERGYFDLPDWGLRNKDLLQIVREKSSNAMKTLISSGAWMPEKFFEEKLIEANINFAREYRIETGTFKRSGHDIPRYQFIDFFIPHLSVGIELDGIKWHNTEEAKERDVRKNDWCSKNGVHLIRIPSHHIYKEFDNVIKGLINFQKNHSGDLGCRWWPISKIIHGVVNNIQTRAFSWKYDLVLHDEEHSFCCETIFIHNCGYRYAVVPMGKDPNSRGGGTDKSQMYHKAIQKALEKPSFSPSSFRMINTGRFTGKTAEIQQVFSADPLLRGFYRTRIFDDATQIKNNKGKKWNFILFRIMSENPASNSKWEHPGIKPQFILKETERWLNNNLEDIFNEFLDEELNMLLGK